MPAGFLTPRRIAIGVLCLVSLVVCCGLAWWQWNRFESASGTFQNLGYVLQWPLFGLFPAFMVLRIRKLRREAAAADDAPEPEPRQEWGRKPVAEVPRPRPARPAVTDDEDEELAAYNRYLAELHARDQEER
ncbi:MULTISPECIES: hypothetical protein [Amycolatopsis]|uniref:DNA-binding transcriptional regulator of glucitol operon n=2 Tax=Amycolatopsis TaxID=1813 RepID=A0A1I3W4F4_9PSEU|nr:hypothetical protein [Amycolatopsis sacchari]SFK01301.1 DNA-binding transcriptional regulator of glucitol operon [Amycolatopsis sacchari]